jgi:hypothetical protein
MARFTAATSAANARVAAAKRKAGSSKTITSQALDFLHAWHQAGQLFTADLGNASNAVERAIAANQLAQATSSWDKVTARLHVLRAIPAPGSLSPAERRAIREAKRTKREPSAPKAAPKESLAAGDRGGGAGAGGGERSNG